MERHDVSVGENPVISSDIIDGKMRLTWKTSLLKKDLDFLIDKCIGCGLCLPCPWDAITLGPVIESAAGRIEGAPLVLVDPEACTFCGLCDSACIFGAFRAKFEGEDAINEYNRIDGQHIVDDEKCAPCLLCAKICPQDAIEVEIEVDHKKELVKYPGEEKAEGTIKIDEDKCSFCGLCELLCPEAIKIFWSEEIKPPDFKPAVGIRVDENECDYCGLCVEICPDDAIEVNCTKSTTREIKQPTVKGEIHIDDELCVDCTLCAQVCPYDALDVTRPFSGRVEIQNLEKCDPTGCVNCFNICPVDAIYPTGTSDKIAILDEVCVYCGACENACPYDVLTVIREGYQIDEIEKARAWERARRAFFDKVVGKDTPPSGLFERDIKPIVSHKKEEREPRGSEWDSIDGSREKGKIAVKAIKDLFTKEPKLLIGVERGFIDSVVEQVKQNQESHQEN
jgi:4Fe-4S ferredoxin